MSIINNVFTKMRFVIVAVFVALFSSGAFAACADNEIDVLGDGTQCEAAKFSVTTTSDARELKWTMAAAGTFYVDCGDGGTLSQDTSSYGTLSGKTVNRTSTSVTTYTCTWASAGAHTVRFGGTATQYSTELNVASISFSSAKIASISGSLGAMFPQLGTDAGQIPSFYSTFYRCGSLTEIPAGLFSGITTGASEMFRYTFYGCGSLTEIPGDLFSGITTGAYAMFANTFNGCRSLTEIPGDLFSGITTGATSMFSQTFRGCTSLTSIPGDLFSGITTGAYAMFSNTFHDCTSLTEIPGDLFSNITTGASEMFYLTFYGCTSLTEIPAGLFSNITTGAKEMFYLTFYGCSNLGGYIPPSTFAGLIANGSPTADGMWDSTFERTKLLTTCPAGTTQYITGYESAWDGKVSCCTGTLPANATYSTAGSCHWTCNAGYYLSNGACVAVDTGYYSGDGDNEQHECTNTKPTNSSYSGSSTSNSCPWMCNTGYVLDIGNGSCCSGTLPENATYSTAGSCEWTCDAGYTLDNGECVPNDDTFAVTTVDMSAGATFTFKMTANGTFRVNCGDGGVLSGTGVSGNTITRTNTTEATYTCTYPSAGVHKITFEKVNVTAYYNNTDKPTLGFRDNTNVAGISGSLGSVFPTITPGAKGGQPTMCYMFAGCTNLSGKIPENLLSGIYGEPVAWQFRNMFQGCTSLEGPIPAGLFADIQGPAQQGVFGHVFSGCTNLKGPIPAGLFSGVTGTANYLFTNTFYNCSSLDGEIPADLFGGVSGAPADYMFRETFMGCSSLTGWIPKTLFSGLSGEAKTGTFSSMFKNCTSLEGYIPPELFANITTSSATTSMPGIFTDSSIATSCEPFPNTKQYITGFESAFDGHVSCEMLPCDGTMYKGRCRQLCPVGRALFHAGEYEYPLWSDKTDVPSPVLHIRRDENTVCYVYLEPNVEGEHGLKLRFTDGNVYRAIDPR